MQGSLGRRQSEDKPTVAGIDGVEAENIAKKCAVRVGILGVYDDVRPRNHSLLGRLWNPGRLRV
jgi:hypothetical protein